MLTCADKCGVIAMIRSACFGFKSGVGFGFYFDSLGGVGMVESILNAKIKRRTIMGLLQFFGLCAIYAVFMYFVVDGYRKEIKHLNDVIAVLKRDLERQNDEKDTDSL